MATGPQSGGEAASVIPGHIADSTIVSCPPTGVTVPADYLGLSIEWSMVQPWFGTSRTAINSSLVNLLNSLERSPSTRGVLRIGGNSQDGYQWNQHGSIAGNTLFSGTINAGLVDALFEVARRSGWKVILGLNLRNNNPGMAQQLAEYVVGRDTGGNLVAFEIGNEPNSYLSEQAYLARYQAYVAEVDRDPQLPTSRSRDRRSARTPMSCGRATFGPGTRPRVACRSRPGMTTPTHPPLPRCCRPRRSPSSPPGSRR
jgi:hypothetical protein